MTEKKPDISTDAQALVAALEALLKPSRKKKDKSERQGAAASTDTFLSGIDALLSDLSILWDEEKKAFTYEKTVQPVKTLSAIVMMGSGLKGEAKVAAAIRILAQRRTDAMLQKMRARLSVFDPSIGDTELRRFVGLLTDREPETVYDLNVIALAAWMWQVKRKVLGVYKLPDPIALNLSGNQGWGKTWVMESLTEPLKHFRSGNMALDYAAKLTNAQDFGKFFVIALNDSGRFPLELVPIFKMRITDTPIAAEIKHAESQIIDNRATLYLTNNYNIADIFIDPTGMRRFWDIEVPNRGWDPDIDGVRFSAINFSKLWASVDGRSETSPIAPHKARFKADQARLKHVTPLGAVIASLFTAAPGEVLRLTPVEFGHVREELQKRDEKPPSMKSVATEISRMFSTRYSPSGGDYNILGVRLKTNSEVEHDRQESVRTFLETIEK